MFKNKHLMAAMFIAPILSIGAYFATDYVVSEQPQVALSGQAYPLLAKSKCRYESGRCEFANGDVELTLSFDDTLSTVTLNSNVVLSEVEVALGDLSEASPSARVSLHSDNNGLSWRANVEALRVDPTQQRIYLVATAPHGATFYGDSELSFAMEAPTSNYR